MKNKTDKNEKIEVSEDEVVGESSQKSEQKENEPCTQKRIIGIPDREENNGDENYQQSNLKNNFQRFKSKNFQIPEGPHPCISL